MHFAIYVYKTSPALEAPVGVSLCPQSRSAAEPLSDHWQDVDCPRCLAIMERLRLPLD